MIGLGDEDLMPFGRHKGTRMKDVPADYLDHISGEGWIDEWGAVKDYIERCREAIDEDLDGAGLVPRRFVE